MLRLYPKLRQLCFCMSAFGGERSSNTVSAYATQNNQVYRQKRHDSRDSYVCSVVGCLAVQSSHLEKCKYNS